MYNIFNYGRKKAALSSINNKSMNVLEFDKGEPAWVLEERPPFLFDFDIPSRKTNSIYIIVLVVAGISSVFSYFFNRYQTNSSSFLVPSLLALLINVTFIVNKVSSSKPYNFLSPDTFFISVFSVFHFSYLVLYAFKVIPYDDEVFWNPYLVQKAYLFCILSLIVFLIGYEMASGNYIDSPFEYEVVNPTMILISKLLILICFFLFWGVIFSVGFFRVISDYQVLTRIGGFAGGRLFYVSQNIAIIALAMYCAASGLNYQKFMIGRFTPFIALGFILSILALGDRGGFIFFAPVPLIAFHYFQKKIKIRWLILGTVLLLFVMTVIGLTRDIVGGDLLKTISEFKYQSQKQKYNPVVRSLVEFGVTIKTVVIAMDLVPKQHGYWYGKTYLDSIPGVLPNLIPGWVRTAQGTDVWITETAFGSLQSTHGRGGSIAMETYMQFGFIGGIVFFAALGVVYRRLYERFLKKQSFSRTVILFISVTVLVFWIRNTIFVVTRTVIWTLLCLLVYNLFLKSSSYDPTIPQTRE
jgi:hypothetical protein